MEDSRLSVYRAFLMMKQSATGLPVGIYICKRKKQSFYRFKKLFFRREK